VPSSRTRSALACAGALAVLAALVLVAFAPAFQARFVQLDDDYNVLANPHFRGLSRDHLAWMAAASWNGNYQPLSWLSYAVDHALSGLDPARFHGTNILLHLATAAVLFFFARNLMMRAVAAASPFAATLAALFAALFFAVHPLRAESVAWVTDRNDLLAGFFFVVSLSCWWRVACAEAGPASRTPDARRTLAIVLGSTVFVAAVLASLDTSDPDVLRLRPLGAAGLGLAFASLGVAVGFAARGMASSPAGRVWYCSACCAFLLSLLSKGAAVALPLVLLVIDAYPLRRTGRAAAARLLVEKIPLLALSLMAGLIAGWARHARIGTYAWVERRTLLERAVQALQGLAFYPWKTLVPRGLVPIVDVPAQVSWLDPDVYLPVLAVPALVLALWRRRAPAPLAAFSAYALLIAPALGLVPFGTQLVSDRYSYLACMPLALLLGGACLAWASSGSRLSKLVAPCAAAAVVVLCVLTSRQTSIWRDSETLYAHQLRFDETPRALSNLAVVWNDRAEDDPARREEWLERAAALSARAIDLAKSRGVFVPEYRLHLGTILLNQGRLEEARAHLDWFVGERPDNMQGWANLGLALVRLSRCDEAVRTLQRAVARREGSADVWRILGLAFEGQGRTQDAIRAYRRALDLAPGEPTATERMHALGSGR
jgi:tetratricopeptide (TPR) repeat protein